MNISVLEKILTSTSEYWILRKENKDNYSKELRAYIIMVAIPTKIQVDKDRKLITLCDLEELEAVSLDGNVYLNESYAPFQLGVNLHHVTEVFPIPSRQREFMIKALELKSHDIYDYKKLIDEVCIDQEEK